MEQRVRGRVRIQHTLLSYREVDGLFLGVHIPHLNAASLFTKPAEWSDVGRKAFSSKERCREFPFKLPVFPFQEDCVR